MSRGIRRKYIQVLGWLCLLLFFASANVHAQKTEELIRDSDYALGVRAFADGDFERAANLWLADAYAGSADAQFNVGVLYIEGKGVEVDRGEAAFWFEKAAEQGHPEAQYNLGHLLLEEQGDVARIKEGIEWWRKSAEQEFAIAQYNYGRAVFFGIGVDQDRPGARPWIDKAAEAGNQRAIDFLARHEGEFVTIPVAESATTPVVVDSTTPAKEDAPPSEEVVERSNYLLVGGEPILMYSRFNTFSPIVTRIDARILLREVERVRNWVRVEVPGGVPGWVRDDHVDVDKGLVVITTDETRVRADPTESTADNDLGILSNGARVLLLEQQVGWVRVLLPEKIPGWIEEDGVSKVTAEASEIARVWQVQRVRLKINALASREVKIAANKAPSALTPIDSASGVNDRIDLGTESVLATVAKVEPLLDNKSDLAKVSQTSEISLTDIASDQIDLPAQPVESVSKTVVAEETGSEVEEVVEEVASAANAIAEVKQDTGSVLESGVIGGKVRDVEIQTASASSETTDAPEPDVGESENSAKQEAPETSVDAETRQSDAVLVEVVDVEVVENNPGAVGETLDISVSSEPAAVSGPVSSTDESDQRNVQSSIRLTNLSSAVVRTDASGNAPVITTLPLNTLVDIVGEESGFAKVIIPGGLPVWIRRGEALIQGNDKALIKGNRVRALSLPHGQDGVRVLGLLPAGEVLRVVNERGSAVRVIAPESITGWVSLGELKVPEQILEVDKIWRDQTFSLLTSYLDAELQEMAVVPTLGDDQLVGTGIPNDNDWLFQETSRKYTLQLFSMQNQSSARSQYRSLNGRGQLFSTRIRGERWYFVLLGKFFTPEAAKAVAERLPSWARDSRVRSLNRLQVNRCKKLDLFDGQEALGLAGMCG